VTQIVVFVDVFEQVVVVKDVHLLLLVFPC
jgi:hypothetical protein